MLENWRWFFRWFSPRMGMMKSPRGQVGGEGVTFSICWRRPRRFAKLPVVGYPFRFSFVSATSKDTRAMRKLFVGVALFLGFLFVVTCARADDQGTEIFLWPNGAPGFESRKDEKPKQNDKGGGEYTFTNVHSPSLLAFLPSKEKATGAAVVIVPGGGHREIWFVKEGMNEAKWLAEHGVAAFVLKYRLAREANSPYKLPDTPTQDGQRAIRLVRSRAAEWGINPNRIGIMGFSAGGELAAMTSSADGKGNSESSDPIDQVSARPDFQALVYSGPLGVRDQKITKEMNLPPTFIAVGDTDNFAPMLASHYLALRGVGVSSEIHIYTKTGHGFGFSDSTKDKPSHEFLQQFLEFLGAQGMLKKA
jgi:acetyl esterase/lipase